jgi:type I restriction enzyme, S subunit
VTKLPTAWSQAVLSQLIGPSGVFSDGDWIETKDQDPAGDVRLVQLADVGDGEYRNRSSRFLTLTKARELACTFLEPGDILVARMPDPLGRACIFPGDPKRSVTAVDVCIIRPGPGGVNPRWLMWMLNAPQTRAVIGGLAKGTTRLRISRRNLGQIPIAVPPLAEQERIVAAIEEEFSRLEAGRAALARAQRHLTSLHRAFVENWIGAVANGSVPLRDLLIEPPANGRSVPDGSGYPVLRLDAIQDGTVDLTRHKLGSWSAADGRAHRVRMGDFLIIRETALDRSSAAAD